MGAIVLDASKVNSYVLPNLVKSKNTMQDAYSTGQSLRNCLPSSFQYRNTINDIVNSIYNIKREIGDIDTIISKKIDRAKTIETKRDSKVSGIASAASKIGAVTGAMAGGVAGAATGGLVTATVGAVVGSKVGSAVAKGLVNTGAKVVNKFTSFCKNIWDGAKDLGKKIYDACKKIVDKVKSFIKEKILPPLKNLWDAICRGDIKYIGTRLERTAASIWNTAVSFVKGIFSFGEALLDAVVIIAGGLIGSAIGLLVDLFEGFKGEWDLSATKAVWKKGIMPFVAWDISGFAFDWMYSDRAYEPFKKGGVVCEIAEGVGYYTGMIIATVATGGVASAAGFTGIGVISVNTIAQGTVAAVGSFGKNSQNNYKAAIDEGIKEHYIQETLKSNPGMTLEEATAIVENNLSSGSYSDYDLVRKNVMNNISGGEIASSIAKAGGKAIIDGGIYFAAGAASDAISAYKTVIVHGGEEVVKNISPTTIKVVNALGKDAKTLNNVTTTIKASKAYISEGYDCIVNGEEYDFAGATLDAASTVIAEKALFKVQGTKAGSKIFGSQKKPEVKKDSEGYKYLIEEYSVKNIEDMNAITGNMPESSSEATKTFTGKLKENFSIKKVVKESIEKGAQKGKEKALKDVTSGIYDETLEFIGG